MRFYLGTHRPNWLSFADYRLFISYRRLRGIKKLPKATFRWCLDSGAFSEIAQYGKWTISTDEYIDVVHRFSDEIGKLHWAAPQDWMCEPQMLSKTGLSVVKHQLRTVQNYCELRQKAPRLPFIPVIQGWTRKDFHRCVDLYEEFGVDLTQLPVVGVGSVCRRQATDEIGKIMSSLSSRGISLHGFGVKKQGLIKYGHLLRSADSMAWSFDARRNYDKTRGCEHKGTCQNCYRFATWWRRNLIHDYRSACE